MGSKKPSGNKKIDRQVEQIKSQGYPPKRFLILCEGQTEEYYFNKFPEPQEGKIEAITIGMDPQRLVDKANRVRRSLEREYRKKFDAVWCVFDRDGGPKGQGHTAESFNNAIQNAEAYGFEVAYTNEAFELWYLLHFNYRSHAGSRAHYKAQLSKEIGSWLVDPSYEYGKADHDMYQLLLPQQIFAIQNAASLWESKKEFLNPEKDNPITTVHFLVQALNEAVED